MACRDAQEGKRRDRERVRKRTEERTANGPSTACGKVPPETGRRRCGPCGERKHGVERARDEGRRPAGSPRHADPEKARARERQRSRERTAERVARGLCTTCGREPSVPGRRECARCAEVRRARQCERYREARAVGKRYGGRDPETCREVARRARRKRSEAGLCRACGARPPADGAILCEPCLTTRRAADRAAYAARRAAGLCISCGAEVTDGTVRCARCAARQAAGVSREKKSAAKRRRYARMRARGLCVSCGAPASGASRCVSCARRSRARSDAWRGLPAWPARYTVIEIATGADHGTYDSEAEVAACLAFAKLSRDEVEIVTDEPLIARFAAWQ